MSYFTELSEEISLYAEATGQSTTIAFAEVLAGKLSDAGITIDPDVFPMTHLGPYRKPMQFLGYGGDEADNSLVMLVGKEFAQENSVLIASDAMKIFGAGINFLTYSANGWIEENLEISSPEVDVARHFSLALSTIQKIKMVLVTDGKISERIRSFPEGDFAGIPISYSIVDIDRFEEISRSTSGIDEIEIDFTSWIKGGLPCLQASRDDSDIQTFLAVVPGQILADIFRAHGSQLLEKNVRTFLSASGAVNKGIQDTLDKNSSRFLAYNNGITATAAVVSLTNDNGQTRIASLRNLQIVNGGQTTSSLVHFLLNKGKNRENPLDDVYVQMKLVIVAGENHDEMVSAISKYANSQNRVSTVDLDSNSEVHIALEQLSRRVTGPQIGDAVYTTKWFYERARGQYKNARAAIERRAELRQFDLRNPKSQMVTKAEWAQYQSSWDGYPNQVSKGSQANFVEFSKRVKAEFDDSVEAINETYFQHGVAKAIMFRQLRKAVPTTSWFERAYLANIVTYAIARFAVQLEIEYPGRALDFGRIWQRQAISTSLQDELLSCAERAQSSLTSPSRRVANVTQWAKQEDAWHEFRDSPYTLSHFSEADLVPLGAKQNPSSASAVAVTPAEATEPVPVNETVTNLSSITPATWRIVLETGTSKRLYPPTDRGLILGILHNPLYTPTEKQAARLLEAHDSCARAGLL